MNQRTAITKLILLILAITILATATWIVLITHSFIQIKLSSNASRFTLTRSSQTGQSAVPSTASHWLNLPTGDYIITYYQQNTILSVQAHHVGPLSFSVISPQTQTATQKPATILSRNAAFVTPLGQGYLYQDQTSRGLSYVDTTGTTDLSNQFSLSTDPNAAAELSSTPINDTVVDVEPTKNGGVVVATTRGVFTATNPSTITHLPDYPDTEGLNYTASAYDSSTNSLFVVPSYSKTIYRYRLDQPAATPTAFYKGSLEINRLAASGGKIVAYYDDVPSLDPGVLAEYAISRQVTPLVINTGTGKVSQELKNYDGSTSITVSGSGRYLAIKRKLGATIDFYDLTKNQATPLPSFDTGGVTWQNDALYLARNDTIWTYQDGGSLTKLADIPSPVTRLLNTGSTVLLTTNASITAQLVPLSQGSIPINFPAITPTPTSQYLYFLPPPETGSGQAGD